MTSDNAMDALPQTTREDVFVTVGRLGYRSRVGTSEQLQTLGLLIFEGLLEAVEANGFDQADRLRSAIRAGNDDLAFLLVERACDATPVEELASVIDRFPSADVLSALAAWQH